MRCLGNILKGKPRKDGRKKTKNYILKCGKQLFEKVAPSKEMLSSILKYVNGLNENSRNKIRSLKKTIEIPVSNFVYYLLRNSDEVL